MPLRQASRSLSEGNRATAVMLTFKSHVPVTVQTRKVGHVTLGMCCFDTSRARGFAEGCPGQRVRKSSSMKTRTVYWKQFLPTRFGWILKNLLSTYCWRVTDRYRRSQTGNIVVGMGATPLVTIRRTRLVRRTTTVIHYSKVVGAFKDPVPCICWYPVASACGVNQCHPCPPGSRPVPRLEELHGVDAFGDDLYCGCVCSKA